MTMFDPAGFDLAGRVAVVTGGNGGIGLGMARGLATAGARVVVAARNAEKAASAVAELGAQSTFIALDVADESSCRAVIDHTENRFGRLDILVNNAGTSIRKPPEAYTAAEWHAVLDTNLTGAFLCSQAAHPVMKRSGGGRSSISARCSPSSAQLTPPLMPRAKAPASN